MSEKVHVMLRGFRFGTDPNLLRRFGAIERQNFESWRPTLLEGAARFIKIFAPERCTNNGEPDDKSKRELINSDPFVLGMPDETSCLVPNPVLVDIASIVSIEPVIIPESQDYSYKSIGKETAFPSYNVIPERFVDRNEVAVSVITLSGDSCVVVLGSVRHLTEVIQQSVMQAQRHMIEQMKAAEASSLLLPAAHAKTRMF